MAEFVLKDAYFLVDGRDFAPQFNSVTFNYSVELQDRTSISDTNRRRVAGLLDFDGSLDGFWAQTSASTGMDGYSSGSYPADMDFDAKWFAKVGPSSTSNSAFAIGINKTTGKVCYFGSGIHGSYDVGGTIGELMKATINFQGSGNQPLIRGEVAYSNYTTATSTNGPGVSLGAVATGEDFYAGAYVQGSTSGSMIAVLVSSTDASNFAAGTTRATFTTFNSTAAELVKVEGPITDTAWRVELTGSTNPAYNLLVAIGKK